MESPVENEPKGKISDPQREEKQPCETKDIETTHKELSKLHLEEKEPTMEINKESNTNESTSKTQSDEEISKLFFKKITGSIRTNSFLYEKPFPYYKRPVEVGFFSRKYKNYIYNRNMLKIFAPPLNCKNCKINLNEGYEEIVADAKNSLLEASEPDLKDSCPESTYPHESILQWIMKNKNVFFPKDGSGNKLPNSRGAALFTRLNTDFVCERYTLRYLLRLPYPSRFEPGCSVAVIRFRGTYYLFLDKSLARFALILEQYHIMAKASEKSTPLNLAHIDQEPEVTEKHKKMKFWGVNFERFVTTRQGEKAPNTEDVSLFFENFYSFACSTLDSHTLCIMSEVDCEDPKLRGENKYIELKTSRLFDHGGHYRTFYRYKLIDWWTQCFLNGVSKVVCGFRDDNGIVHELKEYFVEDLPHMAQNALRDPWRPEVCFNFLSAFLDFVKSIITEDDNKCYYVFASEPGKEVKCFKVVQDLDLLPDWYVKWDAWDKPCTM